MVMNERVMQFRIGMFVIVAGLVLTMLIVWFGESPQLFRDHVYVVVHYAEAPGVAEGIPVRKSGIRVGTVTSIVFDDRPNKPDGVLVTLSLERKYKIKAGSVPHLSRSLIGDVTIDLLPGTGPGLLPSSKSPVGAPVIEGAIAPDPSKALAAATKAFEKAGTTLQSIDLAANGIAKITKSADQIGDFIDIWTQAGRRVSSAADGIDRFIVTNEKEFQPAVTNLRQVSHKLNETLDPATQAALKTGIDRFSSGFARFDSNMASASPLFQDLGASAKTMPVTDFGVTIRRLNLIASDIGLLTRALNDGRGRLNPDGSIQKLLLQSELHDNLNKMSLTANEIFGALRPIVASFRVFAEKVARDPASISRGALQRQ
jgi:phospholipid/cholesterol/gamma-HCH transport system substrate-binding protein